MEASSWKVSLHGGHSRDYCEHARDPLREVLEAAVAAGYATFGVSEHAPRVESRFLYATEREKGYDTARLLREFEEYAAAVRRLSEEFSGRLVVLCGFETEVIPKDRYAILMQEYRKRYNFDFMVGSVHYVDEIQIDGETPEFERAIEQCGGLESLACRYYQTVAQMVADLKPEVVGHLDVIAKNAGAYGPVDTPRVRDAAAAALEIIREYGCILDLNTAGYRKGLDRPYPAPWLLELARGMKIPFCFGDDSHSVAHVGAGLAEARNYLRHNGIDSITCLTRINHELTRRVIKL